MISRTTLSTGSIRMSHRAVMREEETMRKGIWLEEEDDQLVAFVSLLGDRKWDHIAKVSGLRRSGKSCRLRWKNYLRPNLKRENISAEEERIIVQLHGQWGNKWSKIAQFLPGRTDNEIKNYWKTYLRKRLQVPQDDFQSRTSESNQDTFPDTCDKYTNNDHDHERCSSAADGLLSASGTCSDHLEASNYENWMNSPYESRLLDWISEPLYSQGEMDRVRHLDSVLISEYPIWDLDGGKPLIWDHSISLWDCKDH
ncbi:transcription factor MYB27-like isoform X1 [Punica granatum]|uniref:Transcription factor MYB27-like isoform X1 n=2 Tax=Punica granatum TaxID=22663 RepID=A0A6P8DTY8_PUNGR|nr:transcription factor MYB27-like isoform X1 [Punica granatum]